MTSAAFTSAGATGFPPLEPVPSLDLERYAGRWYEIARYPNRFQRDCVSDTTATYTLRSDGKVTVLNECREADGKLKSAKGTAKPANENGPASKLKVTFFWPFYGKYWVIDLDLEYQWAVVSEPGRAYLWILSRTPRIDEALYDQIVKRLIERGFDAGKIMRTKQSG